ncbi:response regulator [Microvirga makkahensis]|uniref:Response regulator n=1 Tax=Microvirga makkahensis TaxID=1128670 RepID=A0A7X3MPI8_9HYPH|nr:response regulator [Microvirga makkahensis]MXQ10693.1 response regulator [Microvirga makkahensis]
MPLPSPIRILFAEDERFLRELLTKQLQARGYIVEATQSGDEALAILQAGIGIDILLTDINMPGALDGWALAEHARHIQPRLGIIYATNECQDPTKQLIDSHFVAKPYQVETIVDAISRIVSRQNGPQIPPSTRDDLSHPGFPGAVPQ